MSEPKITPEIEDVLSSIRRLVSEDLHPPGRGTRQGAALPTAAGQAPAEQVPAEKLILTPALRVVEPDASAGAAPPAMQDVVARLGAAVDATPGDWEAPEGDPSAWDSLDPPARLHLSPVTFAPDPFDPVISAPLAAMAPDPATVAAPEDPPRRRRRSPPPQPEALAPETLDPATLAEGWADRAEAEVRARLARDLGAAPAAAQHSEGMAFDEEVLRGLVRDILREELAGTLGERITRNVRKLVRAEIARALAVRDFE